MSKTVNNNKIICIVGTTASGKTKLGVDLAYKFNGEIVSADSRQVYKGMDIGTGKDLAEYVVNIKRNGAKVSGSSRQPASRLPQDDKAIIPYHLIDVVSPNTEFSLAKYQKLAYKAIDDILKRGKLPIIVGGTGLYAQAIVEGFKLSLAKPDKKLRQKLEKLSINQLFSKLKRLNKKFAEKLHESDKKNKRRLVRYIEMASGGSECIAGHSAPRSEFEFLLIGLTWPRQVLRERIYKRLIQRLENEDMAGEVERLHKQGVSWKRLEDFGLEYKYIAQYLQGKLDYDEMVEKLNIATRRFAKRQMSWYQRWEKQGAKIHWVKNKTKARKLTKEFLIK